MEKELIFVYNAEGGLKNVTKDFFKKLITPDTQECQLCKITYSPFGMKGEWKDFIEQLPYTTTFLHKDEFISLYPKSDIHTFPIILKKENGVLTILIDTQEMNGVEDIHTLIQTIQSKNI